MSQIDAESKCKVHFHHMGLDDRILKAIAISGWMEPTLIQEKAIPFLLEGKDVLVRARTGSGKTAAFVIPIIQRLLLSKQVSIEQATKAVILAPTSELCDQIYKNVLQLTCKCSREVRCVGLFPQVSPSVQKSLLVERPDIVVTTPSRLLLHARSKNINLQKSLEILVIDEADLIFSFGYEKDVKELLRLLPKVYQAVLASATLSQDVLDLKQLVLHNAVTLKLKEPEIAPSSQLSHYHLAAQEDDKATILYALLKLQLVRGKSIIFVRTVDRCYKLKLYLEQFQIRTCVLNSELPASSRCHAVQQFNNGLYDIIIASDERSLEEPGCVKSKRKKDKESGVARGIDFQFVANVINFDFPPDVNSYIHRTGRTARGTNHGTALSFISLAERPIFEEVEAYLKEKDQNCVFQAYQFKMEEVEGFRYRSKDAWQAVTKIAIQEARLKEIKQEMINCQKLKGYFADNPRDLQVIRHDKTLHTVKIQPHLANVPDYLVPPALRHVLGSKITKKKKKQRRPQKNKHKYKNMKNDPLAFHKTNK